MENARVYEMLWTETGEMNWGFQVPCVGAGRGGGPPGDKDLSEPKRVVFPAAQVRKECQIRLSPRDSEIDISP